MDVFADVFIEHLVKKKPTGVDTAKKIGIVLAVILLLLICFTIGFGFVGPLAILLAFGVCYGAYWLISGMSVEYEYILTNKEIDVDKIVAQRKRKRLVTVSVKTFDGFGPYKAAEHVHRNYDSRILACVSEDAPDAYYATFQHSTLGRCLLVFNPDDRIINNVKQSLPRTVGGHANSGNRPSKDQ